MQPITMFDSHFRAAEVLLKVYRLLDSDADDGRQADYIVKLREVANAGADEAVILLLNDLFFGLVRERPSISQTFFGRPNLSLLLRQTVVSACTAMDVFFPALLDKYLPAVVDIRQRNFLPVNGEVKDLFKDFRLRLDEIGALLEPVETSARWEALTTKVLDHCKSKTLSNVDSISAVLLMIGIDEPWKRIAARAGLPEKSLRDQINNLIKRRNDIVHRGDRTVTQTDDEPRAIDFTWTQSHVMAVQSVVHACDAMADEATHQLRTEAGVL